MLVTFDDLPTYRDHILVDGAFDPLHAGHLAYLAAARTKGPLLCAVASDAQIRAKGKIPFLPQGQRVELMGAMALIDHVYAKDRPTEQVLEQMRPKVYVKGADWRGKLPYEQIDVLARYDIPAWFPETPSDSSSERLRAWARADDAQQLEAFERLVQGQKPASTPWEPVTDYSFEARKAIEGKHPELIKEVFAPEFAFDVGCGPDEILCRLLRDLGVHARGIDPQREGEWRGSVLEIGSARGVADLVICREVLEHLTIREIRQAVANLCKLSSKFVYVTTRFAQKPAHLLSVDTSDDLDPTHITMLNQDFLRTLFVLEGAKRRADLEQRMDWMKKGRCLVYEV